MTEDESLQSAYPVHIPVMETMRQHGINPEILGASRVEGFS